MQHPDHRSQVAQEVEARWENSGRTRRQLLDFRCSVAQELWNKETEEVSSAIEAECLADHERELEEYEAAGDGSATSSLEDQAE